MSHTAAQLIQNMSHTAAQLIQNTSHTAAQLIGLGLFDATSNDAKDLLREGKWLWPTNKNEIGIWTFMHPRLQYKAQEEDQKEKKKAKEDTQSEGENNGEKEKSMNNELLIGPDLGKRKQEDANEALLQKLDQCPYCLNSLLKERSAYHFVAGPFHEHGHLATVAHQRSTGDDKAAYFAEQKGSVEIMHTDCLLEKVFRHFVTPRSEYGEKKTYECLFVEGDPVPSVSIIKHHPPKKSTTDTFHFIRLFHLSHPEFRLTANFRLIDNPKVPESPYQNQFYELTSRNDLDPNAVRRHLEEEGWMGGRSNSDTIDIIYRKYFYDNLPTYVRELTLLSAQDKKILIDAETEILDNDLDQKADNLKRPWYFLELMLKMPLIFIMTLDTQSDPNSNDFSYTSLIKKRNITNWKKPARSALGIFLDAIYKTLRNRSQRKDLMAFLLWQLSYIGITSDQLTKEETSDLTFPSAYHVMRNVLQKYPEMYPTSNNTPNWLYYIVAEHVELENYYIDDLLDVFVGLPGMDINAKKPQNGFTILMSIMNVSTDQDKDYYGDLEQKKEDLQEHIVGVSTVMESIITKFPEIDINTQDIGGDTALLNACRYLTTTVGLSVLFIEVLATRKDLDANIVNARGQTALDIAKKSGYQEAVDIIEPLTNQRGHTFVTEISDPMASSSNDAEMSIKCALCDDEAVYTCECERVGYCSVECQRDDWEFGHTHRKKK